MSKLSPLVPSDVLRTAYYSLIESHMRFDLVAWIAHRTLLKYLAYRLGLLGYWLVGAIGRR